MAYGTTYGRFTNYGERVLSRFVATGHHASNPYQLRLFKAITGTPTDDPSYEDEATWLATFEECNFDGYTGPSFIFGAPVELSSGLWMIQSTSTLFFAHNGDGSGDTDNDVLGWYVTLNDGGGETWMDTTTPIYYRFFDSMIPAMAFMSPITVLPAWKLFGEEDIVCP